MVAASLGAQVTIIERAGLGGSAVLTDVVPSKTLIATADLMTRVAEAGELGVKFDVDGGDFVPVMRADLKHINDRLLNLARRVQPFRSFGLPGLAARSLSRAAGEATRARDALSRAASAARLPRVAGGSTLQPSHA